YFAVQVVGDHDTHRVDVRRVGDGAPVVLGALVSVSLGGVVGDGRVGVGDRDEPYVWSVRAEQRGGRAIAGRVCPARHAATDHARPDGFGASHRENILCVSIV